MGFGLANDFTWIRSCLFNSFSLHIERLNNKDSIILATLPKLGNLGLTWPSCPTIIIDSLSLRVSSVPEIDMQEKPPSLLCALKCAKDLSVFKINLDSGVFYYLTILGGAFVK